MFRNLIGEDQFKTMVTATADIKRGVLVTFAPATGKATSAVADSVDVYFVDKDSQPMGVYSEFELDEYSNEMDLIKKDEMCLLVKPQVGQVKAFENVTATGLTVNDKLSVGANGVFVKAVAGKTAIGKYLGTYDDNGHTLYMVEFTYPTVIPTA